MGLKDLKKKAKSTVESITATDLRRNVLEHTETVTQILVGMHSDIDSLNNKIESINNKVEHSVEASHEFEKDKENITSSNRRITVLVYIALFLSLLSMVISIVE